MCLKRNVIILILLLYVTFCTMRCISSSNVVEASTKYDINKIEKIMTDTLNDAKVPGASMVVVDKNQTFFFSYGYQDKDNKVPINEDTLFELGSMSKSFTALGILMLEEEGLISMEDDIRDYIPWLELSYKTKIFGRNVEEKVNLKISDFFYHRTGIPFRTIGYIPEGDSEDMLEKTVQTLVGVDLDFYPGTRFSYATINYDVLALVIQKVTGISYEDFVRQRILKPLKLNSTYVYDAPNERKAVGYKWSFMKADPYEAPSYRGNTAAGYIISDARDMERWMKIQLGLEDVPDSIKKAIELSHKSDVTVLPHDDCYYAGGWQVNNRDEVIKHGGNNPNYSSMITMRTRSDIAVCVLTDMNSNAAEIIAENVVNYIENKELIDYEKDTYRNIDIIFSVVILLAIAVIVLYTIFIIRLVVDILKKKRSIQKLKDAKIIGILSIIPLITFLGFVLYYLPNILIQRLPWTAVNVWVSPVLKIGCVLVFIAGIIFFGFVAFIFNFTKKHEKNYAVLVPLSIINGLGSALILFIINESFNRNLEYSKELLVYFVFAVYLFVYTMKLLQGQMIIEANEIVYEKKMSIIDSVMNTTYENIEQIGQEKIFTTLNNDVNSISQVPNVMVRFISDGLTLLFCMGYLCTKSIKVFLFVLFVVIINSLVGAFNGKKASKYLDMNRDIQDLFVQQINDFIHGFKELALNKLRKLEFWDNIRIWSRKSVESNEVADVKFLGFNLYNVLVYNLIFGAVVFIIPLFVQDIEADTLREELFIVFYMLGPFNGLTGAISEISQIRINMRRITDLVNELKKYTASESSFGFQKKQDDLCIKLENVVYRYQEVNERNTVQDFKLGPVNLEFKTGDITFIIGGNGSGKSTLAKIMTGLYKPVEGRMFINGEEVGMGDLNECFSSIFSDYYIFKKLYGIDYEKEKDSLIEYFKLLQIDQVVTIDENKELSNINLSTGQRKRLALAISFIENRSMFLFDEWAAEQDPKFRDFFYSELLLRMKERNKGVIVISHDDRYFNLADHFVELDRGIIVKDVYLN